MAITLDPTMAMNSTASVYGDASTVAADRLSSRIETATSDDETLQACKEFEAYMLEQIYKRMEESAKLLSDDEESEDGGSQAYVEMFKDSYYQDLANKMMSTGKGIGIAEQLYQSITNQKLGISNDTTTAAQAAQAVSGDTGSSDVAAQAARSVAEEAAGTTNKEKAETIAAAASVAAANTISSVL